MQGFKPEVWKGSVSHIAHTWAKYIVAELVSHVGTSQKTSKKYRRNNNVSRTTENDTQLELPIETMFTVKTPSPGQYDNFKTFFDRGKRRNFTIGKKF